MVVRGMNQLWVSDITYVRLQREFIYLAAILDVYSRRVVGWSISRQINSAFAIDALVSALKQRRPAPGLVHHSDRGVQYACTKYVRLLEVHGIIRQYESARKSLRQCVGRELYEDAKSGGGGWTTLPELRRCQLLDRDVYRRCLQQATVTFGAELLLTDRVRSGNALGVYDVDKERKGAKQKESRGLWKLPELWKNEKQFFHSSLNRIKRSVHSYHTPDGS